MIRRVITTAIVAVMLIDTALFHAPAATAVEFGWQSLPEGGVEYLIQVEPQLIETFREHGYTSDLPPGLRDIRRVRVVVGTEKLPNQGNLAGPAPAVPPPMGPQLLDPMRTFTADTPPPTNADQEPNKFTPVPDPKTVPAAGVADVTPMPTLHPGEGPPTDSSVQDTVGKPNSQVTQQAAPERPWGLLMVLLFALFLSLGANTYLVWIHQALRARFRALTPSPSGRGLG